MSTSKVSAKKPKGVKFAQHNDIKISFIERVSRGEEIDLWALAGELASPNFYWRGGYYSKKRYALHRDNDEEHVTLRPGVPHGSPQADTISADAANANQRRIYGHLKRLEADAIATGREESPLTREAAPGADKA